MCSITSSGTGDKIVLDSRPSSPARPVRTHVATVGATSPCSGRRADWGVAKWCVYLPDSQPPSIPPTSSPACSRQMVKTTTTATTATTTPATSPAMSTPDANLSKAEMLKQARERLADKKPEVREGGKEGERE